MKKTLPTKTYRMLDIEKQETFQINSLTLLFKKSEDYADRQ